MLRISMDIDLTRYTEEELVELSRRIVERIRALRQGRCRERMAEFKVGDRVRFQPDCGHEVVGTIVRLKQKSVTIVSSDGPQWRVAPVFVRKISDEGGRREAEPGMAKLPGELLALPKWHERDRGKA